MKRKGIILLVILFSMLMLGCGGGGGGSPEEEKILQKIELSTQGGKREISADNKDSIVFVITCYDEDYEKYTGKTKLLKDGEEYKGIEFKSEEIGTYKFKAASEDGLIESEEIIITVKEIPVVTSIVLTGKPRIISDNTDETKLGVKVYDQAGGEIKKLTAELYKDGSKISNSSFKTKTVGEYKFIAKIGNITSNELTVKSIEYKEYKTTAEKLARIKSICNEIVTNGEIYISNKEKNQIAEMIDEVIEFKRINDINGDIKKYDSEKISRVENKYDEDEIVDFFDTYEYDRTKTSVWFPRIPERFRKLKEVYKANGDEEFANSAEILEIVLFLGSFREDYNLSRFKPYITYFRDYKKNGNKRLNPIGFEPLLVLEENIKDAHKLIEIDDTDIRFYYIWEQYEEDKNSWDNSFQNGKVYSYEYNPLNKRADWDENIRVDKGY